MIRTRFNRRRRRADQSLSVAAHFRAECLEERQFLSAAAITSVERLPTATGKFDFRISGSAAQGAQVSVQQVGVGIVGHTVAAASGIWTVDVQNRTLSDGRFEFSAAEGHPPVSAASWSESNVFRPNILLVNVDDMRADDVQYMPFVSTVLASEGTMFNNMFAPTSLCAPSRATLMTGLFAERTGNFWNRPPLAGSANLDLSSSLPVWLDSAGYRTGLFGKDRTTPWQDEKMPSQKDLPVPPGWDEYFAVITAAGYNGFGYTADHNGTKEFYGTAEADYATDVLHRKVTTFIDSSLAVGSSFFAYMAPFAPHQPYTPAPRHFGKLNALPAFHPPSFNLSESGTHPFDAAKIASIDTDRRRALESLLAVDQSIQNQYRHLQDVGVLDNTVIAFTSDNGYLRGEHGVANSKNVFYEEAIRVPLIMWDGRLATHSRSNAIVLNADIGPTLAWMSGAIVPAGLDGKNLVPLLTSGTASVRQDFLIHHWTLDPGRESSVEEWAVRNDKWVYATRTTGATFLFDLVRDPFQLNNLASNPAWAAMRNAMAARLEQLKPSDRIAPVALDVSVTSAPAVADGSRAIRITARVTDLTRGNSEIRTPALSFSPTTGIGFGIPLDASDGRFDSATEVTFLDMPWTEYVAAGSPNTVYLRFRDLPGNWSAPLPVALAVNQSLRLNAESDTGSSSADGLTIDNRPKFSGTDSIPGATITLFATALPPRPSVAMNLGTATADSTGRWTVTSMPFSTPGVYVITGEARSIDQDGQIRTRLYRPVLLNLCAVRQANGLVIANGSESADRIRVRGNSGQPLDFWLNDVWAGTLPGAAQLEIRGNGGADLIQVDGNVNAALYGGEGADTLIGGSGNDLLSGGPDSNKLSGRSGNDTYLLNDLGTSILFTVSTLTDLVFERDNEGIDTLSFVTPYGIVADLNPDASDPSILMNSPYRVRRTIKFGIPDSLRNVEQLNGSNVRDIIRVGQQMFVQGQSGDDLVRIMQPLEPGQTLLVRQFTSGLALPSSVSVIASIQSSTGTLRLNKTLPSGISFLQLSDRSIRLQGPLASVNSFLLSDGLRFTAPAQFTGQITLSLRSAPVSTPTTLELDIVTFDVTYRPAIVTGGSVEWTEGGRAVLLAPLGTASDRDANLTGAVLKVSVATIVDSSDRLMIVPQTQAPGTVTLNGSQVLFDGVAVGTWSFLSSSQNLQVTFSRNATMAALQAILRRIGFANSSGHPVGGNRTIRFQLVDGARSGSAVATTTVLVKTTKVIIQNQVLDLREDANTSQSIALGRVLVKDDPLEASVLSLSGTDAGSFQITGRHLSLKPGTLLNARTKPAFRVRVTAKGLTTGNIIGVSADYVLNIATTVPVITSPSTSQSLRPVLAWTPIGGAVSYDIWIRNAATRQNPYRTASTSTSLYTPAGDLEIGRFEVWGRSVNVSGRKSEWSLPGQLRINTPVTLKPPVAVQTTPKPTIAWNALPGAVRYDLWLDNVSTGASQVVRQQALTTTSWTASTDLAMGTYRVWVRGIDAEGTAAFWSVPSTLKVLPAPAVISPLTATPDRTPEFVWTAVKGSSTYEIWVDRTDVAIAGLIRVMNLTANRYIPVAPLVPGSYRFWVRAVRTSGERSAWSAAAAFEIAFAESDLPSEPAGKLQVLNRTLDDEPPAVADVPSTSSSMPVLVSTATVAPCENDEMTWPDETTSRIVDEYFSLIAGDESQTALY